ncbi:hypothetical protein SAMN05443287_104534 [Micromonospora phaseoli]|uniref:Uncharacterized protein n=1 Tax=Micromonospora phaseoli TaxID=1144548 RepID=A0A1H6ZA32_9ACTN|nr:hypothetical protein [Micromonospora phaseoli]PZW00504.1 hypothetical protein CLV64_103533 [Micromonospora phaseoli]GIJ80935.1 hypothetical protein Xph01_53670 [Micromonospora phaseoli]SEJ46430.1 hypothetical protein SAMN05443287_104534 [Micromonospora phaseoli]
MTKQQSPTTGGAQSKVQAARSQAPAAAHTVQHAGGEVAHGAVEEGKATAAEANRQVRHLLGEAANQLNQQADTQQKRAAAGLRSLGDELESMSSRDERHGLAGDLARQAAEQAHRAAEWLDEREPGAVVAEVRDFARRRPGLFLAGAAVAGMLAGRLTRSLAADGEAGAGGPAEQQPPPSYRGEVGT